MWNRFRQLQTALGLDTTRRDGNVPYELSPLRPGGATFYLQLTENGDFVRRRGRWLSSKVLEIYIQEAAVATYQSRLTPQCRTDIQELFGRFQEVSKTAVARLRANIPTQLWPQMW